MKTIRVLLVLFFVLSIAFTGNSMGDTSSGNIHVETVAAVVCVIGSATLDLGTYTGSSTSVLGSFDVQCSDQTPYTISYGEGSNFLGGERRMTDGSANYLVYFLYCESSSANADFSECGNGTTIGNESADTGSGLVQPFAISADLTPAQFVPAGTYVDDVIATLTY